MATLMSTGAAKLSQASKGFGFIAPYDSAKDAFVHTFSVEASGLSGPAEGQKLSCGLVNGRDGKVSALNLQLAEQANAGPSIKAILHLFPARTHIMQTPARKRAEALFAKFTSQVESATETDQPPADRPKAHASGPKTLHLPSDTRPADSGVQGTTRRRSATAPRVK